MSLKALVFAIHFVLLTAMLCCTVYRLLIAKREGDQRRSLKQRGLPWRVNARSRRASRRMSLYFSLLWAGVCLCLLMEGNDEFRIFWFFFGLFFLVVAAIHFDAARIQKFFRSRFLSPDPQSEIRLS
ncbi:MAG TPA: hypothetical protein VE783_09345 [Candidatus Limnocylindrales bacterium]|jgi:hypothetical protein|nr:hypothetical protein [Candidatus Limnocylindrales bacterium]